MIRILIYDLATYCINALPAKYRLTKFILFVQALLYGWQWNRAMLDVYRTSTTIAAYNSGTTYAANTMVVYNFTIYISLQAANTGNTPDTSPLYWYTVAGNFIGLTERIKYNGGYLTLTWALNRYFSATFRQPPYPAPYGGSGTFSDIYITNTAPTYVTMAIGTAAQPLAIAGTLGTGIGVGTAPIIGAATSYQFTVHIPTATFTALGASTAIRTAIVNKFLSVLIPAGISWSIVTY